VENLRGRRESQIKEKEREGMTSLTPLQAPLASAAKGRIHVTLRDPPGEHDDVALSRVQCSVQL